MSDALMILPAVTPPPAAPASTVKGMGEPVSAKAFTDGAMPVNAEKIDTESAEQAAAFSEVLASVASGFVTLPKPELQLPVDAQAETFVDSASIQPSRALSLWDLVPALPEDAAEGRLYEASATEFSGEAMPEEAAEVRLYEAFTKEFSGEAIQAFRAAEQRIEAPEMLRALIAKTGKSGEPAVRVTPERVDGDEMAFAQAAKLPANGETADVKLPPEAKVVADLTVEPTAPKETLASSERVVKTAETQTQDEAEGHSAPVRTPKAETARPAMPTETTATNEAKVTGKGADEIPVGPFGTLRPATSAPERSVSGRQTLPDEKAEGVGKDFAEAQRVIALPATETRSVDSIDRGAESKAASASPARQVSEAVQTAQRGGVRVVEMELKPEGMGTLRLRLSGAVRGASAEHMHLEIQALDPKAHALLLDNLSELRSALGQWEIRLMPPVVNQNSLGVMASSEGRGYAQSGSQRQHGQERPERNAQREEADGSFAEQFGSMNT